MSHLALSLDGQRDRLGLKGPRAAEWLSAQGVGVPSAPNTWTYSHEIGAAAAAGAAAEGAAVAAAALATSDGTAVIAALAPGAAAPGAGAPGAGAVLVARLGAAEFFLEDGAGGAAIKRIAPSTPIDAAPGVYPILREDWAFDLQGEGVHEVLTQVCNVNFAALGLEARPLIMTLMIGVAVLVVPRIAAGEREYRIWCDPTFGPYLGESLGAVVSECGGKYTGASV